MQNPLFQVDFVSGTKPLRPGNNTNSRYSIEKVTVSRSVPSPSTTSSNLETEDDHDEDLLGSENFQVPEDPSDAGEQSTSPSNAKTTGTLLAYTLTVTETTTQDQGVYTCHAGPNGAQESLPIVVKRKNSVTVLPKLSEVP